MARTLLERLRAASRPPGRGAAAASDLSDGSQGREAAELYASICEHLRQLLNSRQDMADACPKYGLPDPGEVVRNMPQSSGRMREIIEECIGKYEPRLRDVKVTLLERPADPMVVAFRIQARLASERSEREVWFETLVAASGRVNVKPR